MNIRQNISGGFHTPLQQLFLLEERFRQAGVQLPDEADSQPRFHGIKCRLAGHDCVISMRQVAEVFSDKHVTAIPGAAAWVDGVMNYRGTLVPVYQPENFLQTDGCSRAMSGPLIVLKKDRRGQQFNAIRVQKVYGMQKFSLADLQDRTATASEAGELVPYVRGLVCSEEQQWLQLDIDVLLAAINSAGIRQDTLTTV